MLLFPVQRLEKRVSEFGALSIASQKETVQSKVILGSLWFSVCVCVFFFFSFGSPVAYGFPRPGSYSSYSCNIHYSCSNARFFNPLCLVRVRTCIPVLQRHHQSFFCLYVCLFCTEVLIYNII